MARERDAEEGHGASRAQRPPRYREPTFGQRLLARLADTVVLLPFLALAGVVAEGRARVGIGLLVVAAYEVAFVVARGQTFGKIVMSTRVVDVATGELPDVRQASVRWLVVIAGSLISLVLPALDALAAFWTLIVLLPIMRPPLHRGLHDFTAGTVVTSTAGELERST